MKTEEFVRWLKTVEIDKGVVEYQHMVHGTQPSQASNPFEQHMLALYHRLPPADQQALMGFVRQARIDATSRMLAIIDGIADCPTEFQLIDVESGNALEDLTDLFLVQFEDDVD